MRVSDARTEFERRKKDISDIDAISGTFLQWCKYINRMLYRELTNVAPEQYITSQTYTLSPGTSTYALPVNFQDISPMGTGMYEVDSAGNDTDRRLPITSFGSTQTGWYPTPASAVFTPTPASSKTYKLRYIPTLAELTGESSTLLIPDRFSEHLMNVLDACYNVWDEDQNAEVFNDERVIRTLQELVTHFNPAGQTISLPDFSGAYYF